MNIIKAKELKLLGKWVHHKIIKYYNEYNLVEPTLWEEVAYDIDEDKWLGIKGFGRASLGKLKDFLYTMGLTIYEKEGLDKPKFKDTSDHLNDLFELIQEFTKVTEMISSELSSFNKNGSDNIKSAILKSIIIKSLNRGDMTIGLNIKGEGIIKYFSILSTKIESGITLIDNETEDKLEINFYE